MKSENHVLVTGGAGYIGSHMVLSLLDSRKKVVVLDNLSTGSKQFIDKRAKFVHGCVSDTQIISEILSKYNVNDVMHFAGSTVVPESISNPLKYYDNNTIGTLKLIGACTQHGISNFIFSSTAAVYQASNADLIDEDTSEINPTTPYGKSKYMSEVMLREIADTEGFRYGILRYFNVAGADPLGRAGQSTPNATHLIKVACQAALGKRDFFEIFGTTYPTSDGSCIRDFIHVSDLAEAHLNLLDHMNETCASVTLNCGYGRGYSVKEIVETVKRVSNNDFIVKESNPREGDLVRVLANPEKIRKTLNWQPKYEDISTIISSSLNWEKQQPN